MKTLIIGGTGILSRAVAQASVDAGHEVTILTDGLGELPEPQGIQHHLIVDRNDHQKLQQTLAIASPGSWDLVIDVICYDADQARSLLSCIHDKSKHTIVISSAILYSPELKGLLTTDSQIASPQELGKYGREKYQMESIWMEAWHSEKHPVTILRPPHIIGVGSLLGVIPLHNRDSLLINRLINCQPLILADGGRQLIQVVFNEDIAKVIFVACGKSATFGKIYNCANPEIITGYQYFEIITNLLNVPLNVKNIPSEAIWQSDWGWSSTAISRLLSMETLAEDVGYVPDTPLEVALSKTLAYLQENQLLESNATDNLQAIVEKIDQANQSLQELLSNLSKNRPKPPVDLRMNADSPKYLS